MRFHTMVLLFATIFLNACGGVRLVDETEHCVETRYGKVVREQIPSGMDWFWLTDATCFSLTEKEVAVTGLEVQTADSVKIAVDTVTFLYKYDPATVFEVFKDKRSPSAAESEIMKAAQEGIKKSFAQVRVVDLFGDGRAHLTERVREGMQTSVRDRAEILNVFFGGKIRLPQEVEDARIRTMTQIQNAAAEREKLKTDSIAAANRVLQSEADRRVAENKAAVYQQNKVLADLEVQKAQAQAWAEICKGVTTCIIGGNVVDRFLATGGN